MTPRKSSSLFSWPTSNASETGRPIDLRSDHHGFEHLTTDTNAKFLPKQDMSDYRYRLVYKLISRKSRGWPITEKHTLPI